MLKFKMSSILLFTVFTISELHACPKLEGAYTCIEDRSSDSFDLKIDREGLRYTLSSENDYTVAFPLGELIADGRPVVWPGLNSGVGVIFCDDSSLKVNFEGLGNYQNFFESVIDYRFDVKGHLKISQTEFINHDFSFIELTTCELNSVKTP